MSKIKQSLDGYGCPRAWLEDEARVRQLLIDLAIALGWPEPAAPFVERYAGAVPDDWGLSGLTMGPHGRLSLHTFPESGSCSLDVTSRPAASVETAERLIKERLGAKRLVRTESSAARPSIP